MLRGPWLRFSSDPGFHTTRGPGRPDQLRSAPVWSERNASPTTDGLRDTSPKWGGMRNRVMHGLRLSLRKLTEIVVAHKSQAPDLQVRNRV